MRDQLLLESYRLNEKISLKNRIVMAPMTRNMADDDLVPTQEMADYYARRADAGLIVTEGTIIRLDGKGYSNAPGIFTKAQIDGWKRVTDKVHKNNGCIFLQIWHVGRVSHPHFLNGDLPIAPSETVMTGRVARSNGLVYGKSRAAGLDEIKSLVESYAIAAKNAISAGFDGIEIHGANGYLVDQFLHYCTNHRTDDYGETPENMARFALDVAKACGAVIGFERVGLRLSPGTYLNEMVGDKKDAEVFKYLLRNLSQLKLAYVHTGNFDDQKKFEELDQKSMTQFLRDYYHGTLIACGGYDFLRAETCIQDKQFDLIALGRPFIANPGLIECLKANTGLKPYHAGMLTTLY